MNDHRLCKHCGGRNFVAAKINDKVRCKDCNSVFDEQNVMYGERICFTHHKRMIGYVKSIACPLCKKKQHYSEISTCLLCGINEQYSRGLCLDCLNNQTWEEPCLFCDSDRVVKCGLRDTKYKGAVQRFKCMDCGKHYTSLENSACGFVTPWIKIDKMIDLRMQGVSLRNIASKVGGVTHQTVKNILLQLGEY